MNKKSKIAGILTIITGAFGLLWGVLLLTNLQYSYYWGVNLFGGVVEVLFGLFVIVCGYLTYNRKAWGLGLAGAIAGFGTFFPTTIAAIVLLSLGKQEF
jgi:hypothetical protein